jgi:hypothetical protein
MDTTGLRSMQLCPSLASSNSVQCRTLYGKVILAIVKERIAKAEGVMEMHGAIL